MKKLTYIMVISIILLTTGCGKKLKNYNEISLEKYNEMIENKESFAVVIGSSTCGACEVFKVPMKKFISSYQVDVKYVDLSKLSKEESDAFLLEIGVKSTPTTLFIEEGKQTSVYNRIVGAESYSNIKKAYEKMGYIKGE